MTSDKWVSSGHSGFPTNLNNSFCVLLLLFFVKYNFVFFNLQTMFIAYFIHSRCCERSESFSAKNCQNCDVRLVKSQRNSQNWRLGGRQIAKLAPRRLKLVLFIVFTEQECKKLPKLQKIGKIGDVAAAKSPNWRRGAPKAPNWHQIIFLTFTVAWY